LRLAAVERRRSGKTFNPKVVGSIPTRPIGEETEMEPNSASSGLRARVDLVTDGDHDLTRPYTTAGIGVVTV
jgi:hypothetical protein